MTLQSHHKDIIKDLGNQCIVTKSWGPISYKNSELTVDHLKTFPEHGFFFEDNLYLYAIM